ncbi:MAG: class IV adenylate cyclase [Solirubrobacteraceae bacterium]
MAGKLSESEAPEVSLIELVELVESVRALPYGRPSARTVEAMLRERRGTCSTKHLYLAQQLAERFPATKPQIIHRIYRLDRASAEQLFGAAVAETVPAEGLIDVHRYLTIILDGQRLTIDATFPGEPWDGRTSLPLACGLGDDVVATQEPDGEKRTLEAKYCDATLREPFIAALTAHTSASAEDFHGTPRRNIELKASDPDPVRSLQACRDLNAKAEGTLWQRDTYFDVPFGGLKLREEKPGRPHLIQFERADEPQQRESRYRIIEVEDAQTLRAALTAAIGLVVVVTKRRQLFLWRDVRIHLDDVEELGTFIELEAVAPPSSDLQHEHQLISQLRTTFDITDERLIPHGYATQLKAANSEPRLTYRYENGGCEGCGGRVRWRV